MNTLDWIGGWTWRNWAALALIAAGVLACATARADEDHAPRPDLRPEYYDTLDEAGAAGLRDAAHWSRAYEFGGAIFQTTNHKYRISRPETDFAGDSLRIGARFYNDYAGYTLVGDFHTHPCNPWSHYPRFFSDADVRIEFHDGTVGYMADLCSGLMLRFVPGVTPTDKCWTDDDGGDPDAKQVIFTPIPPEEKAEADCGSSGETIGLLEPKWKAVVEEVPGPKTAARGYTSW